MATKDDDDGAGDGSDESTPDLGALLGGTPDGAGDGTEAEEKPKTKQELVARLKTLAGSFKHTHAFKVGQLVQWKKSMKNRRNPAYGHPVVVTQVLPAPVFDREEKHGAGSPYFREPLTIVAGRLDKDGDLVCYHYDGRRMEPFVRSEG